MSHLLSSVNFFQAFTAIWGKAVIVCLPSGKMDRTKRKKGRYMSRRPRKKKKNRNSAGRISFLCIGIFLVLVLSVQMVRLYQKNEALVQTEQTKQNELSEQEDKQKELEEQEQYIQSDEYKEKVAKDKLGLVYDNETIFREK